MGFFKRLFFVDSNAPTFDSSIKSIVKRYEGEVEVEERETSRAMQIIKGCRHEIGLIADDLAAFKQHAQNAKNRHDDYSWYEQDAALKREITALISRFDTVTKTVDQARGYSIELKRKIGKYDGAVKTVRANPKTDAIKDRVLKDQQEIRIVAEQEITNDYEGLKKNIDLFRTKIEEIAQNYKYDAYARSAMQTALSPLPVLDKDKELLDILGAIAQQIDNIENVLVLLEKKQKRLDDDLLDLRRAA